MIRTSLNLAIVAALLAVAPAAAQQRPPINPPRDARSVNALERHMTNIRHAQQAEFEAFRNGATGNNLGPQPLERIDLANRVSTLIELGRCNDARTLANDAGERIMALRARQLCRAARD